MMKISWGIPLVVLVFPRLLKLVENESEDNEGIRRKINLP